MQHLVDDHLEDENNKKRIEAHAQKLGKKTPVNANPATTDDEGKGGGKGVAAQATRIATAKAVGAAMAPYLAAIPGTIQLAPPPPPPNAAWQQRVEDESWHQVIHALAAELNARETTFRQLPVKKKARRLCVALSKTVLYKEEFCSELIALN